MGISLWHSSPRAAFASAGSAVGRGGSCGSSGEDPDEEGRESQGEDEASVDGGNESDYV